MLLCNLVLNDWDVRNWSIVVDGWSCDYRCLLLDNWDLDSDSVVIDRSLRNSNWFWKHSSILKNLVFGKGLLARHVIRNIIASQSCYSIRENLSHSLSDCVEIIWPHSKHLAKLHIIRFVEVHLTRSDRLNSIVSALLLLLSIVLRLYLSWCLPVHLLSISHGLLLLNFLVNLSSSMNVSSRASDNSLLLN